jgi:hypothetical protein
MRYSRSAAVAAIIASTVVGLGAQASLSGADEGAQVYGMLDALDPLVGADWAPPSRILSSPTRQRTVRR